MMGEETYQIIAEDLEFPEGPVAEPDGSLLVSEMAAGRITRIGPDGERTTLAVTGGGPNGLSRLSSRDLVVCQSGGSRWGVAAWPMDVPGAVQVFRPIGPPEHPVIPQVQIIDATGVVSTLATEFLGIDGERRALERPSDVCADAFGGFYMTDGGRTSARQRTLTGLLYGTPEGGLREVLYPLEMPNGVALAPGDDVLYIIETRTRRVWRCEVTGPGALGRIEALATVPSGGPLNMGGADGVCVDHGGNVLVATLGSGGLTAFTPDGVLLGSWPIEDVLTTNVAISVDGTQAYVTLASTGRVAVLSPWCP